MLIYKENSIKKEKKIFFKITTKNGINFFIHEHEKIKAQINNLSFYKYPCELTTSDSLISFFNISNIDDTISEKNKKTLHLLKILLSNKVKLKKDNRIIFSVKKYDYHLFSNIIHHKTFENDKEIGLTIHFKDLILENSLKDFIKNNYSGIPNFILENKTFKQYFLEIVLLNKMFLRKDIIEIHVNTKIIKEIQLLLLEKGIKSNSIENILYISESISIYKIFNLFKLNKLNNKDIQNFVKYIEQNIMFTGFNQNYTTLDIKDITKFETTNYEEIYNIDIYNTIKYLN